MKASRGVHFMQVSRWLGHATYSLTLDVCGDYVPETDGGAVNSLPEPAVSTRKSDLAGNVVDLPRFRESVAPTEPSRQIDVGNSVSGGATITITSGDTPQVIKMAIVDGNGGTYMYEPSVPVGGPIYASKDGDAYTITGELTNADLVPKQFDIHVTCH
jgi:hypothetical protein